jgi:hypothetical protein
VGGKHPFVLLNADSELRGETAPLSHATKNQRVFEAGAFEREDAVGDADGAFDPLRRDVRRAASA